MILCTTVRKLADKQATIYKLVRHPVQMCGTTIESSTEYFTTMMQARKAQGEWIGTCTVTSELCTMQDHYMMT